ncbi:unnamed protein product [Merluccius merluccius]
MAKTIKHVLLNTLDDLSQQDLRSFCARLLDREEGPRVRRSALEDKDTITIVDVLVSTFTAAGAGMVAVEMLRAINCLELANVLVDSLAVSPKKHFVDRHRSALVQRISSMAAILDQLLDRRVVSKEQYDTIIAEATRQDQVRQLYSGPLMSSGTTGKDIFLSVLGEMEPFLIEDLRRDELR